MQNPSGYRVESRNSLDLRDLHGAEASSHYRQNHNLPPAESTTGSSGLYMTNKYLPGPSRLFPADSYVGAVDPHHPGQPSNYRGASSYTYPLHSPSAELGHTKYGGYPSQIVANSGTLTPANSHAFQTQPLPSSSWTSGNGQAIHTALTEEQTEDARYSANHKPSQGSSYPIPSFTPPLTGRDGFRGFGSSTHPAENGPLYLGSAPDTLDAGINSSATLEYPNRLHPATHALPTSSQPPTNNLYKSSTLSSSVNNYPSALETDNIHSFAASTNLQDPASSTSGPETNSRPSDPFGSLNHANTDMNPFSEHVEESRKRMRYMEEALSAGGSYAKDYHSERDFAGSKRGRKGMDTQSTHSRRTPGLVWGLSSHTVAGHSQSISIPGSNNISSGLIQTFDHPQSAGSASFPLHSSSATQAPYDGNRFLPQQSPPPSSRNDQFGNPSGFHPEYMTGPGLNLPSRPVNTDSFLHEVRGIADRFHRDMSALLARTPSSVLNVNVRNDEEGNTKLDIARRVIDEVKRVSQTLVSGSPALATNTSLNRYPAGQGPSPVNPSPLGSFVNHPLGPSPMLSGDAWRPGTASGQMDSYTPATTGALQTPGTAGFAPHNSHIPFNSNSGNHIPSITTDYAEGNRWSQMPQSASFAAPEHTSYGEASRTRGANALLPPGDHTSNVSTGARTPIVSPATGTLPKAPSVNSSTSPREGGSSRRNLPTESADGKEGSHDSEKTDVRNSGSKSRSRRQPNGPWREEEAERLRRLAEQSKGRNANLGPDEIDWDYVVTGFDGTRTRHQILIKAVYLGIRTTTTHQSRLVRQKQYHGNEKAIPGLSQAKLQQYLDERREEEHDMEVLGIDKEEASSRRKQNKAKRKKAELEAEIQAKAENGYVASGVSDSIGPSFGNVLNQDSAHHIGKAINETRLD
ncbi:hypothetical protein QFC21_000106 [Naganishia friedmannii]|uniref:Uncharacterized protein n=1 Tax=Naganishia friedmannii TaxID=89922 RepID=A0ACC2WBI9_9TREE|nr:hypothetical protein QFC21_000106 [Naganishia friedmannii]